MFYLNLDDCIGELLYIGLNSERRRCRSKLWRKSYRLQTKQHMEYLVQLNEFLISEDTDNVLEVLDTFQCYCKEHKEIGKYYRFSTTPDHLDKVKINTSFQKISLFMKELLLDLILELSEPNFSQDKVAILLNVLHKLPKVYLGMQKETLCNMKQSAVLEEDAYRYAFQNMDDPLREKYASFFTAVD